MIFKSFSQFLTESNSASFSPINEKQDEVVKLNLNTPDEKAGEKANFSVVAKVNPPNEATEEQAKELAKKELETYLSNNEKFKSAATGTFVFITVDTLKQRGAIPQLFNNDNAILRAVLSFRMADRFDMAKVPKVKPYLKPGGINIWLDTDMDKLVIDGQKVETKTGEHQKKIEDDKKKDDQTKKDPIVLPAADADVLAFLKEKLLGDAAKVVESVNGTVALAKSGVKSREVKFAQLILLAPEFNTAVPALKLATTLGSADGSYGPNTAKAYGILLDDKDTPHNSIEAADIEKLAKYCTLSKLLKPRLQQIWDASELKGGGGGNSGTSGTSGTAGTAGTAGTGGFTYVNKP
jgi:hypothetical protein